MQFLIYDPNPNTASSAPPSPEMMAEMGAFIEEATRAGIIVATGALQLRGCRVAIGKRDRQVIFPTKGRAEERSLFRTEQGCPWILFMHMRLLALVLPHGLLYA